MTLAEIKAQIIENIGYKHQVGDARLVRLINRTVEHITNLVEAQFKPYNTALTPVSLSIVSGTLEYKVGDVTATPIRKITQCERTDTGGDPIDCQIIDFRSKNDFRSGWPSVQFSGRSDRPRVYFRRIPGGDWYLGFPTDPSQTMTIKVYYAPMVVSLSDDTDVPREIPEHHHELLAVRATVILLSQLGMDTKLWERQYAELRQTMETDLSNWNRTGPRSRRMRATVV